MAEKKKEEANKKDQEVKDIKVDQGKNTSLLFIALASFNMLVVIGVGIMLFLSRQKEIKEATISDVVNEELKEMGGDQGIRKEGFIGRLVPLETFLVNLSGSRGNKLIKVSMDLEVDNEKVIEEIDVRKPVLRDVIITILSSKTYVEISSKEGKEDLRESIKNQLNKSLTLGYIKEVFFTEFIYN